VTLTYEDLIVDGMEGVSAQARLVETVDGYVRLLWDYSDGNPRVALHFWLRSLVAESAARARVRLFRGPAAKLLETRDEAGLFLLASLVLHQSLTLAEAVRATHLAETRCRMHLRRLVDLGALAFDGERYRISTHWHRAVFRLLRRRNLLAD